MQRSNYTEQAPTGKGKIISDVRLSGFSREVLDTLASSRGCSPEEALEGAVSRYLADRSLRPPGWASLPLPEGAAADEAGTEASVAMELSRSSFTELGAEASEQGVSIEALLAHVVMYAKGAERDAETSASQEPQRGRAR